MTLVNLKPVTPSQRFNIRQKRALSAKDPESRLTKYAHRKKGRNCYGRITSRRRGGGHKRLYRKIDFMREKQAIPATVQAIEYDPNRTAHIALLAYADGEKRYILAPKGVILGSKLMTHTTVPAEFTLGDNLPLRFIPQGTKIHAIELYPKKGAQLARSAGVACQLVAVEGNHATIKMPSGEMRLVQADCRATIGEVGNSDHQNVTVGKAGRTRWKGKRPRVRGVAMNPVDHPMGGGEGKSSGGGNPVSPWGQLTKGFPTRKKSNRSNAFILIDRKGRKVKS